MERLSRGKLAKSAGVGMEAVRFYEKKGLLPKAKRSEGGYRLFTEDDVKRVHFIKRAQELGFTLREVKELLDLNTNPRATCSDVREKADHKITEVDAKIKDLQRMRRSLKELAEACGESKRAVSQCRVTDCFEAGWKCE